MAVSGGGDSLALLLLAHAAFPGGVEAATVDHGLRTESADEAAFVGEICRSLEVPHATLTVAVEPGNVQARARAARYDALAAWAERRGLVAIATAHQLDDQAETMMMRLNRGSGIGGLAGVRRLTGVPGHGHLRLVRPLLGWRRAELAALVESAGIAPICDPSNEDTRYDRVRVRQEIAAAEWLDPAAIARSAGLLADAKDALDWVVSREWLECVERDADGFSYRALASGLGGDRVIRPMLVVRIFSALGRDLDMSGAAGIVDGLIGGGKGNVAGIEAVPDDASGERRWIFRPETPRRTG